MLTSPRTWNCIGAPTKIISRTNRHKMLNITQYMPTILYSLHSTYSFIYSKSGMVRIETPGWRWMCYRKNIKLMIFAAQRTQWQSFTVKLKGYTIQRNTFQSWKILPRFFITFAVTLMTCKLIFNLR